jgi:hypothetical protein
VADPHRIQAEGGPVAVPDRDEVVLRFEVREVNLLVLRLVALAVVIAVAAPVLWAIWPT